MDEQEKAADTAREQTIQGLRDLADFLERHPEVPRPESEMFGYMTMDAIEDQRARLQEVARLAGRSEKIFGGHYFWLRIRFGPVTFNVCARRDAVCRKVTREKVLPAEAEKVIPAQPERTVTEEEWVCDEPLLADG